MSHGGFGAIEILLAQRTAQEHLERQLGAGFDALNTMNAKFDVSRMIGGISLPEMAALHDTLAHRTLFSEVARIGKAPSFGLDAAKALGVFAGADAPSQLNDRLACESIGLTALHNMAKGFGAPSWLPPATHELGLLATHRDLLAGTRGLDKAFANAIRGVSDTLPVEELWRSVGRVQVPWILPNDPARSFEAFGALSDVAQSVALAASENRGLFDDITGYAASGRKLVADVLVDPRIDELPPAALRPLARASGIRLYTVRARADTGAGRDFSVVIAGSGTCTTAAHGQVQSVEVMLRAEMNARLPKVFGPKWQQRLVHPDVRATWQTRQAKARVGHSDDLIDYSNFGELRDVLLRKDVWERCFAGDVTMPRAEMAIALERLMDIAHAVHHARNLTREHFVWCFAEVGRVLQAFGIAVDEEEPSS